MKKLVFALAVVFSMSFAACGNKEAACANADNCDSTNCTQNCDSTNCANCTENVEATLTATETVDSLKNDTTIVEQSTEVVENAVVK